MTRKFSHRGRVKVGLCRLCFVVLVVFALLHIKNQSLYAHDANQISKHAIVKPSVENPIDSLEYFAAVRKPGMPLQFEVETAALPPVDSGVLIVPSLGLEEPIMRILVRDGSWDISKLNASVGHLQTTGEHPGDDLAMTFVGHTTIPPRTGPFAYLYQLSHGDRIIYRWNGMDYIYEVNQIMEVVPTQVGTLYENNGEMMMLVTCAGWNGETGTYDTRLVTRAILVDKQPTQLGSEPSLPSEASSILPQWNALHILPA